MKAILIPFKDPTLAKQRLAPLLKPRERTQLSFAMFQDTLQTVVSWRTERERQDVQIFIVTSVRNMECVLDQSDCKILREENQCSESKSVDWASQLLHQRGVGAVLRLPTDIPLLQKEDIDRMFCWETSAAAALMVPSRDGLGTNALFRRPPDVFPSRFGPYSLYSHQKEARRAGIPYEIYQLPRIALDIDEPADLEIFMESESLSRTRRLIDQWNVVERLTLSEHR